MSARALALLLVVIMTPAAAELIETGVHIFAHGDLGHLADHGDAPLGGDEHGCSAVLHLCGCHTSSSLPSAAGARTVIPAAHRIAAAAAAHDPPGRGAAPPPLPPPIA